MLSKIVSSIATSHAVHIMARRGHENHQATLRTGKNKQQNKRIINALIVDNRGKLENCLAFGHECKPCQKPNHFTSQSKKPNHFLSVPSQTKQLTEATDD